MNGFSLISHIRQYAPHLNDQQAFAFIARTEQEIVSLSGGESNPKLAHFYRGDVVKEITSVERTITLPDESGQILNGGVTIDDDPIDVIPVEYKRSAQKNWLLGKSCCREGNTVTFYNITPRAKPYSARIAYAKAFTGSRMIDGNFGYIASQTYGSGGESLRKLVHKFPVGMKWVDDELNGAVLKYFESASAAIQYTVFRNIFEVDGIGNPGLGQVFVLSSDTYPHSVTFPTFSTMGDIEPILYPFVVIKIAIPDSLIPAIIARARRELLRDPRAEDDVQRIIMAFSK